MTRRAVVVPLTEAQKAVRRAQRERNKAKSQSRLSALLRALQRAGVPPVHFTRELPFLGFKVNRPWYFDLADPELKIAIEIDGGTWNGGRHGRGDRKQERDKLNQAQAHGWIVLTFSGTMIERNMEECVSVIIAAMRLRKWLR